jgi:sarcosine oxidase subunit gamma
MIPARSPLAGIAIAGRHGAPEGAPGIVLRERADLALATIIARRGQSDSVRGKLSEAFGLNAPVAPRRVSAGTVSLIWSGPGQWLALARPARAPGFVREIEEALDGLAAITDQTDGRVVVSVTGPKASLAMAKLFPIDLHPSVFDADHAALTKMALINVQIWRDGGGFEIAAPSSYAGSFWTALMHACEEYGVQVES